MATTSVAHNNQNVISAEGFHRGGDGALRFRLNSTSVWRVMAVGRMRTRRRAHFQGNDNSRHIQFALISIINVSSYSSQRKSKQIFREIVSLMTIVAGGLGMCVSDSREPTSTQVRTVFIYQNSVLVLRNARVN